MKFTPILEFYAFRITFTLTVLYTSQEEMYRNSDFQIAANVLYSCFRFHMSNYINSDFQIAAIVLYSCFRCHISN